VGTSSFVQRASGPILSDLIFHWALWLRGLFIVVLFYAIFVLR